MKKFIVVFIGVALVLLCAAPALAAGFSLSPAEVEFDVPSDGSTTVEFLVYDFGGDLEISLEDIPLRVDPQTVHVSASAEGTPMGLTFYGDESLGSEVFNGKILFLASSGGNVAFGVKVIATVNHIATGEPPEEGSASSEQAPLEESSPVAPEEETPQETSAPAEPAPTTTGLPILQLAGIIAGTAVVITVIVVFARRRRSRY